MNLRTIQAEADALAKRLAGLRDQCKAVGPRADRLVDSLKVVITDTDKLVKEARQPSRIGLVGAFTAGKTRVVETLLGLAGRFGNLVDEKPTSGNIAEFELRAAAVERATVDQWRVEFMDEATDAARILSRLLLEARNEQNRDGLSRLDSLLDAAEFTERELPPWVKVQGRP
jgi:hypothetical protein